MKPVPLSGSLLSIALVLGLVGPDRFPVVRPSVPPQLAIAVDTARGAIVRAASTGSSIRGRGPSTRRDDGATVRRRLREEAAGTYIDEILASRDSNLARWPDRGGRPLRVWIQDGARLPDWDSTNVTLVRDAFREWAEAGIPLPFVFVQDSLRGDVHVTWVDRFDDPISGKTRWARDDEWWIVEARILLALHHSDGEALDAHAVKAIALHEVGHLLGLDHTADASNIMTPRVRVRELSAADRATVRLLYSLPAGAIR
jgi:hypothetical protein